MCSPSPETATLCTASAGEPKIHGHSHMAEGKSKSEIICCLKRFVAREIYGYLCRTHDAAPAAQMAA